MAGLVGRPSAIKPSDYQDMADNLSPAELQTPKPRWWDYVLGGFAGKNPSDVNNDFDTHALMRMKMIAELRQGAQDSALSRAALAGLPNMGAVSPDPFQAAPQQGAPQKAPSPPMDSGLASDLNDLGIGPDSAASAPQPMASTGMMGARRAGGPTTLADVRPQLQALILAHDPRAKDLQSLYNEAAPTYDVSNGQRYDKKTGALLDGVVGASMDVTPSGEIYNKLDPNGAPNGPLGAPPIPGYIKSYDPDTGKFAGWRDPNGSVTGALGAKSYAEAYPAALAHAQTTPGTAVDARGKPLQTTSTAQQLGLGGGLGGRGPVGRGGGGIPAVGQGPGDAEEVKGRGKALADLGAAIDKGATDAQSTLDTVGQLRTLMPNVKTGAAANAKYGIGALAAGMGVNVRGLDEAQALTAAANKLALQARSNMPGQMSDSDRNFLVGLAPGMNKTPGANKLLVDSMEKVALRQKHYAASADAWRQNHDGSLAGFQTAYGIYAARHPLFSK